MVEGNKERVQVFQGNVIARQGGGLQETYTVRKLSYGVGVERTFPLHTPTVTKIEVVKRGDVRRAKLYYLRDRIGKAAKIREKRSFSVAGPSGRAMSSAIERSQTDRTVGDLGRGAHRLWAARGGPRRGRGIERPGTRLCRPELALPDRGDRPRSRGAVAFLWSPR